MHPPPASERHTEAFTRAPVPLFVLLAALLLYVLRFGYDYGLSDQDEFLPYLLHRLDPLVLAQDWFVLGQASAFSIRTYFVSMLQVPAQVMPVWLVVLGVYGAAWLLTGGAVYALGHAFTRNRLAAAAAVVTALVLRPAAGNGGRWDPNQLCLGLLAVLEAHCRRPFAVIDSHDGMESEHLDHLPDGFPYVAKAEVAFEVTTPLDRAGESADSGA